MKKAFKKITATVLAMTLLFTGIMQVSAVEAQDDYSATFKDFLVSGMGAAQAAEDFETASGNQVKLDTADYESLTVGDAWLSDTEAFLADFASKEGAEQYTASTDVTLAKAKAISIAYAIECAEWSISQNRGTDLAKEAEYMFLSHYVDRKSYFWNQGKIEYLLDGEIMSEYVPGGALAKWITDSDRQSYDAYMGVTQVSTAIQKVGNITLGYSSLKGNQEMLQSAKQEMSAASAALGQAKGRLTQLDSALTGVDVFKDVAWIYDQFKAEWSNDPEVKLGTLYQRFMEDGTIFTDYGSDAKETLVQSSLAMAGGYVLGGCVTAADVALGGLKSEIIGFTIESYTDFFNYVAWLSLQYGYSGRFALRLSDYLGL